MGLPPLANVFAARLNETAGRAEVERRAAECDELTPWATESGWVVAVTPLPNGPPEPSQVRAAGLVFAEGRDRLIEDAPERATHDVRRLLDVVTDSPDRLAQFAGDFGFLYLDGECATVVRSCGGLVPFYVRRLPHDGVAVATRLDLLVRLVDVEHRVDPLVLALNAGGWALNPDGRTFLREVSVIPRGCYARISPTGTPSIGRYWDPRPNAGARLTPSAEHPGRLRQSLLDSLSRDLDPDGGNLIGLSGGVDSSSTAALAAGVLGRDCAALTFLTPDPVAQANDLRYIDALCEEVRLHPTWRIVLEPERWLELIRQPQGHVLQVYHPILCALPELARSVPVSVLFGGEAADEMCGSALTMADWMDNTSVLQLLSGGPKQLPFGRRRTPQCWALRRWQRLRRRIQVPYPQQLRPFVRSEVQEEYREWRARRLATARADRRPLLGLALWCEHDGWVAMNWEATSALGIRRSLPFYTREVHELAFDCHPRELVGPSTKKLLRAALHDDVPHLNLHRPDKGAGGWGISGTRMFSQELPDSLRTVVDDRLFEAAPGPVETVDVLGLTHLVEFDRRLSLATRGGVGSFA